MTRSETWVKASRKYRQTPKGKFFAYKTSARRRKIPFKLSFKQFCSFWARECWYCGYKIRTVGIDRVNNDLPYEMSNVRPACLHCNTGKMDMTCRQWINLCVQVAKRHGRLVK